MSKILYLTYDGLTDPLGQSQIIPYIQGIAKGGHQFVIVSFEKKAFQDIKPIIEQQLMGFSIQWVPIAYTKKPPIFSTIWDIYRLRKKVFNLHREKGFDLVHCRSYITSLVGLSLKRKKQVPFIFDMRGFWADERIDGRLWNLKNPIFKLIYKYFKRKEKQFLLESDQIVSLTEAAKKIILEQLVSPAKVPITVIPCCVDSQHFDPTKPTLEHISRKALQIEQNAFVLGYIGSIGTWYMLSEMLAYFKVLLQHKKGAIFLFVTQEVPDLILEESVKLDVPIDKIRITAANREEVPSYLQLFNRSIFFIKPSFSKQASSPTKQGELMSMNIPIICNTNIGDTDSIVKKYNSGVLIEAFTEETFGASITKLLQKKNQNLRNDAIDFFGIQKGIASYLDVYESCLKQN